MGAPLSASVNMRPSYDGVGHLRRSEEAKFQAYLALRIRRIDTTAHLCTYAAYLEIRRRKCYVNPGLCVFSVTNKVLLIQVVRTKPLWYAPALI